MTKTERKAHIFERDPLDWYVEPERCTTQLLEVESFVGRIVDPACGCGNIVKALAAAGYANLTGTDIKCRVDPLVWWWNGEIDFLADDEPQDNIVFNPPYFGGKGTEAFVRHALEVTSGKVCAFVDRRFMTGKGRARGLFAEHPPARVYEITPRPSCPPGDWLAAGNKAGGGTADYAWAVWDKTTTAVGTAYGWLT